MAVVKMFSVLDVKADLYASPFCFGAVGQAVRAFSDLVQDPNTMPGRHPEDYKLVQIGEFDDVSGEVRAISPHVSLGFGPEYQRRERVQAPVELVKEVGNG